MKSFQCCSLCLQGLGHLIKSAERRWKFDGLNSVKYEILSDDKLPLFRRILVQLDEKFSTKISQTSHATYWRNESVTSSITYGASFFENKHKFKLF